MFQSAYKSLKGMVIRRKVNISGKEVSCLCLWLDSGEVLQIHSTDVSIARDTLEERMKILGLEIRRDLPLSLFDETEVEPNAPTGLPIIFSDMVSTI